MIRMLALPVLLALPLVATAQPDQINYQYLEIAYDRTEYDVAVGDLESTGFGIEGFMPIRDHIHLFAGYGAFEFDDVDNADSTQKIFGVGTNFPFFEEKLSVYGRLGFLDRDVDSGFGNFEDDGILVMAGVRYMPVPGWEIRGGVDYVDLDLAGSDTAATIASDLFVTDVVALTLKLQSGDDADTITLGARFYFGNEPSPASFSR